ncbi:MAG: hypothetical protein EA406_13315 [Rhodospirillales bacterium]|nr:MAG: hypothetical protein EA406_13315 [Rhodospirillales bacterium]
MDQNDILDQVILQFQNVIANAYGLLLPDAMWLFNTLAAIGLCLVIVMLMLAGQSPWVPLLRKVLVLGFFAWLMGNWGAVTDQVMQSFIGLGLQAGGSTMSPAEFMRPSMINRAGEELATPLFVAASQQLTWSNAFSSGALDTWLGFTVAGWMVRIAFYILAIAVFLSLVGFLLSTAVALPLLAFSAFAGTAWIAKGALGLIVSSSVYMMTFAAIASLTSPLMTSLAVAPNPDIAIAGQAVLSALMVLGLIWFAGRIAAAVASGGVALGLSQGVAAAGSAAVVGAATVGAAALATPAARDTITRANATFAAGGSPAPGLMWNKRAGAAGVASGAKAPAGAGALASGDAPSGRAAQMLEDRRSRALPSPTTAVFLAKAAVPEGGDVSPNMQPSNIGDRS